MKKYSQDWYASVFTDKVTKILNTKHYNSVQKCKT